MTSSTSPVSSSNAKRDLFGVDIGLALAFIVGEEFGMALQEVRGQPGIDVPDPTESRRVTLPADCLAGVWAADPEQRDRLDASVLHAVIEEQLTAGYRVLIPPAFPNFSPDLLRVHRRSTVGLRPGQ